MKTLILIAVLITVPAWCKDAVKGELSPELIEFATKVVNDSDDRFENIERQLLATPKKEPLRDERLEILSGLVFNLDKPRAYKLLGHIQNVELRKNIECQYKAIERMAQPLQQPLEA